MHETVKYFLAAAQTVRPPNFAVTAQTVTGTQLTALQTAMANASVPVDEQVIRTNWSFDLSRNLSGSESTDLVFELGRTDLLASQVRLWHYDDVLDLYTQVSGLDYSQLGAGLLIATNISDFSDYTVTSIPEPTTVVLLGLSSLALLRRRKG